jgi:hypothetical protein
MNKMEELDIVCHPILKHSLIQAISEGQILPNQLLMFS